MLARATGAPSCFVDDRRGPPSSTPGARRSRHGQARRGPVADLAALFGEVVAVEQVPIAFEVDGGQGTLRIGDVAEAELAPFRGATGGVTVLQDTLFSTIPGSPAYVGKASTYRRASSRYGLRDVNLSGHNAIQGLFRFSA